MANLHIQGLEENVIRRLDKFDERFTIDLKDRLDDKFNIFVEEIKNSQLSGSPVAVRTGALRNSLMSTVDYSKDSVRARVYSDVEYIIYLQNGTAHMSKKLTITERFNSDMPGVIINEMRDVSERLLNG